MKNFQLKKRLQIVGGGVKKFLTKTETLLLMLAITTIAMLLRYSMFEAKTGDYNSFLVKWFNKIKELGIKEAMGQRIGDYTPAYFYILSFLTLLPMSSLTSIKLVSCVFDIGMALGVWLIVKELTKNKNFALAAYFITLFLPTVFLNSGWWAQCDSIYTCFCVFSLYFLLKNKAILSILMLGIGFTFKLQAIFLAPLFMVVYFKKKIPWWSPVIVLVVYLGFCFPSWLCGRSLKELCMIYFDQAGQYKSLTLNAPTFAALFGTMNSWKHEMLSSTLVYLTLAITLFIVYYVIKKVEWKKESVIDFSLLFALVLPYFLPHMHERYFYIADVLSILYVFIHRKRWYTLVLTQFCSFWVVAEYLNQMNYFSLPIVAVIQLGNILWLTYDLIKDYRIKSNEESCVDTSLQEKLSDGK